MKKIVLFFLLSFPFCLCISAVQTHASYIQPDKILTGEIEKKSIDVQIAGDTAAQKVKNKSLTFLYTIKMVISGALIIYLVYSGVMMVVSMGRDESQISNAKRSLRYCILALLFINIPGTIFQTFYSSEGTPIASVGGKMSHTEFSREVSNDSNLFYNSRNFFGIFDNIVYFIEIIIAIAATIMIVLSGLRIITAGGESEKVSSAKQRIMWSMAGLIFLGFMQLWKYVIYTGDFQKKGQDLFSSLVNLAIFFGGSVAIFFISMAGYYYVTAAGEEERLNKAKSILFNTMLAVVILLGIYTLLNDISKLNF